MFFLLSIPEEFKVKRKIKTGQGVTELERVRERDGEKKKEEDREPTRQIHSNKRLDVKMSLSPK